MADRTRRDLPLITKTLPRPWSSGLDLRLIEQTFSRTRGHAQRVSIFG